MKRYYLLFLAYIFLTASVSAQITANEAILQMRKGINMGNSLEAAGGETGWGNPIMQESHFDMYQEAGFNTVRIPIRWDERTGKSSPYAIQESFLDRVEELVDWGLERDLWIVINSHHDNWIKDNYSSASNRARFDSIWSQIAMRFADKSEKLVFEILNEPHGLAQDDNDEMHERVLSIIRKTNPTRLVIIQGNDWGSSGDLIEMTIPDPDDPYLIGSFHSYDPWPFGLEGTGTFGSESQINTLRNKFQSVKNWSEQNNIPVFLGEFACHKDADYKSRMKHYQTYVELSHTFGFCYCSWDDGGNFAIMYRREGKWREMKDILIYGNPNSPGYPDASVQNDTSIRLHWTNRITDTDHIIVQRGLSAASLSNIDTISSEAKEYYDHAPPQDRIYYYRLIAEYEDSIAYYSHPLKIYMPEYIAPGFDITIQVLDEITEKGVQVANVTFNGVSLNSEYTGEATFVEYEGTYNLGIEKQYYQTIEEEVFITSDTLLKYEMAPTHSDIKIWVKDTGGSPLKDAVVTIGGEEIITSSLGLAKYYNFPLSMNYDYAVSCEGFEDISGSILLERDTVLTIEMTEEGLGSFQNKVKEIRSWPNPAVDFLTLELPVQEGQYVISSLDGKIVMENEFFMESSLSIDVSGLMDGMYFIKVSNGSTVFNSIFVKMIK